MELADRILESAEDMTAADTAPRPIKETAVGVRYWSTMGRTSDFLNSAVWLVALPDGSKKSVLVQSRVTLHKIQEFLSVMNLVAFKRPTTLIIAVMLDFVTLAWFDEIFQICMKDKLIQNVANIVFFFCTWRQYKKIQEHRLFQKEPHAH